MLISTVRVNKLFHCSYSLSCLFVFVTKYRRRCFTGEMLDRLKEVVGKLGEDWKAAVGDQAVHRTASQTVLTRPAGASSGRRFTTIQAGRLRLGAAAAASPLWIEHYGAIR
jgi:hypothetical protein